MLGRWGRTDADCPRTGQGVHRTATGKSDYTFGIRSISRRELGHEVLHDEPLSRTNIYSDPFFA